MTGIVEQMNEAVSKRMKELDDEAKELQKRKEKFWKKNKIENHYARELMWFHHEQGKYDLIEPVKEGLLNRQMRRQAMKTKEHKPGRMTKQDCINYLKLVRDVTNYSEQNNG